MTEVTRTYQVTDTTGTFEITIPETYKVTYGPFAPPRVRAEAGPRSRFNATSLDDDGNPKPRGWVLRIYESDTKQRACFTDVLGFRDLSLPYRRTGAQVDFQEAVEAGNGLSLGAAPKMVPARARKFPSIAAVP